MCVDTLLIYHYVFMHLTNAHGHQWGNKIEPPHYSSYDNVT